MACAKEKPAVPASSSGSSGATTTVSADAHAKDVQAWQKNRAERLKREDGWLSLVGLSWLQEGDNAIGSDRVTSRVVLPAKTPASSGKLVLRDGKVTLHPTAPMTIDGKPVTGPVGLQNDAAEEGPTLVKMGTVQFQIIKRGERHGVRIKDPEAETRTHFQGLDYYPIAPKWRVVAKLVPYNPAKKIPITDVTGMTSDSTSPGALVFTVDGKEYRLDPIIEEGSDQLFIIFRDATSKDETYPAGRYLYADMPGSDGTTVVDFNRAYTPPCAFTSFATCPLPPLQNRLPVRVDAGEKKYRGGH